VVVVLFVFSGCCFVCSQWLLFYLFYPESEKTVRKLICKQLNKNIIDILDPLKTNKTTATENK
jgi:hypothetical protein